MLIHVQLQGDRSEVAWLNRIHRPDSGIVVVHVPPACDVRILAREILAALDRPVAAKTKPSGRTLASWVAAWLRSARPRCDLVLYGAWRLRPAALLWLKPLAEEGAINVWLMTDRSAGDSILTAAPVWHWDAFRTQPWRGLTAPAVTAGRPSADAGDPCLHERLPPFPFWNLRILELADGPFLAVANLYREYLRFEEQVRELLKPTRAYGARPGPPSIRDVLAAVARVTMIDTEPQNLAVFLRFLEETVWWSGGLLTLEIDAILAAVNPPDPADRVTPPGRYDPFEERASNPKEAAGYGISRVPSGEPGWSTSVIDATPDGGSLVLESGRTVAVPFETRWAVRAAIALADGEPDFGPASSAVSTWYRRRRYADPEEESSEILRRLDLRSTRRGPHDRASLEPLSRHLSAHVGYAPIFDIDHGKPVASEAKPLEPAPPNTMPAAAATVLHQLWADPGRRDRGEPPFDPHPNDQGFQWLDRCGLVERDPGTNRPLASQECRAVYAAARHDLLPTRFMHVPYRDQADRHWSLPVPNPPS